jgi:hypothetical protein
MTQEAAARIIPETTEPTPRSACEEIDATTHAVRAADEAALEASIATVSWARVGLLGRLTRESKLSQPPPADRCVRCGAPETAGKETGRLARRIDQLERVGDRPVLRRLVQQRGGDPLCDGTREIVDRASLVRGEVRKPPADASQLVVAHALRVRPHPPLDVNARAPASRTSARRVADDASSPLGRRA